MLVTMMMLLKTNKRELMIDTAYNNESDTCLASFVLKAPDDC